MDKNLQLLLKIYRSTSNQLMGEMPYELWEEIEQATIEARAAEALADAGGTDYMAGAPYSARPLPYDPQS